MASSDCKDWGRALSLTKSRGSGAPSERILDRGAVPSPPVADFPGALTSWSWNFGDGSSSTLEHPSHTYTSSGEFTVSLTVANPYGSDTRTRTDYVVVDNIPPDVRAAIEN